MKRYHWYSYASSLLAIIVYVDALFSRSIFSIALAVMVSFIAGMIGGADKGRGANS